MCPGVWPVMPARRDTVTGSSSLWSMKISVNSPTCCRRAAPVSPGRTSARIRSTSMRTNCCAGSTCIYFSCPIWSYQVNPSCSPTLREDGAGHARRRYHIVFRFLGGSMTIRRADANDAIVGQNIRANRLSRGMSQSDLAGAIGVTFQQVQKYEKGTNRVGSGRLVRVAAALEIRVTTLLRGIPGVEAKEIG